MTDNVESLILEQLRAIRASVERIDTRQVEMTRRVSSVEQSLAHIHGDLAGLNLRMDNSSSRFDHIERRLELSD